MKCHIGVDAGSGLVHTITVTEANAHDITQAAVLIREDDEVVYGDSGYLGIQKRPEVTSDEHLSSIDYRINRRPRRLPHVSDNAKLSTPISNGGLIFTAPLRYAGSAPWAGFTDTIHAGCLLSGGHLSFEFIIFFLVSNIFPNRFLVHIADCCNVISSCPEMLISSFCSKLWMSVKQHQRTFTFQVRHEI